MGHPHHISQSQNPHPFDFAQGSLSRKEREKGGGTRRLYFLVALPSMKVIQVVPSMEDSIFRL
jgi:hypothetical protein